MGRGRELGELLTAFERAAGGRGRLYLVAGEAGIGKTRLGFEACSRMRARGGLVVTGRCWEAGAPAFWPWVQVIRDLLQQSTATGLPLEVDDRAAYVAHLVPELDEYLPGLPDPPRLDGEVGHVPLFDAVAHLLRAACRSVPLVIFLDDLHSGDAASLLLTRYVAGELSGSAVLGIGTYRPVEARINSHAAATLSSLTEARWIHLNGLLGEDVGRLLATTVGRPLPEHVVADVERITGGNPFFVEQVARMLATDPTLMAGAGGATSVPVPDEMRGAVRRRLEPLGEEVRSTLAAASVIGRAFTAPLIQHIVRHDDAPAFLQRAVDAAVLVEDGDPIATYDFAHAVIRETLYHDLLTVERVELHRRVGEALEVLAGGDGDTQVAELAFHFLEAAPSGGLEKAIDYGVRAGERAEAIHAYREAADHYSQTLRTLDLAQQRDEPLRFRLLLSLAAAQHRAGESERAKRSFSAAASIARERNDPAGLGQAALGYAGTGFLVRSGAGEPDIVALLEEALAVCPPHDSALGVMLRGRLAMELYWSDRSDERASLAQEAIEMARRLGDRRVLAFALAAAHFALWDLEQLDRAIDQSSQVIDLARELRDDELLVQGYGWRLRARLELADVTGVESDFEMVTQLAQELKQPIYLWYATLYEGLRAQWAGRFEQAERLSEEAHVLGTRVHEGLAQQVTVGNLIALRRDQGRLAELRPMLEQLVQQYPRVSLWRVIRAAAFAEDGDTEGARLEFERLRRDGFSMPQDMFWTANFVFLSELSALFDDREAARTLYDKLLPFAGRNIVPGRTGCFSGGCTSHYLGVLATVARMDTEAERHFEEALEIHIRMGARVYVARTQLEYAEMLSRRGRSEDVDRAIELLQRATSAAEQVGASPILDRAPSLREKIVGSGSRSVSSRASLTRDGEYWQVAFDGSTAHLKDAKGYSYLAQLLACPRREFLALEMSMALSGWDGTSEPSVPSAQMIGGGAGTEPVLDRAAIDAYRRRFQDLEEELEHARELGDDNRLALMQEEMDFLAGELCSSVGLGGRQRKATSPAERARMAVTRAIRLSIRRIEQQLPALGAHLAASIKTGTYCSYAPDPNTRIDWEITTATPAASR